MSSVYADSDYKEVVAELKAELRRLQDKVGDSSTTRDFLRNR